MRENLLKKQPTWGLRRAQGTGQKSATPATLTKVILVLLTMFLLPSAAWGVEVTKTITFKQEVGPVSGDAINNSTIPVSVSEVINGTPYSYNSLVNIKKSGAIDQYSCSNDGAVFRVNNRATTELPDYFAIDIPGKYPQVPTKVEMKFKYDNAISDEDDPDDEYSAIIQVSDYPLDDGRDLRYKKDKAFNSDNYLSTPLTFNGNASDGEWGTDREEEDSPKSLWISISLDGNYYAETEDEQTTFTITEIKITYDTDFYLSVAGIPVTGVNANDILGDSKVSFTPAEGTNPAKLTLNNATLTVSTDGGAAIESSLDNLIVYLVGDNTVQAQAGSQNITSFYAFKGNNKNYITFQTNVQEPGKIQGLVLEESVFNDVTPAYQEGLSLTRDGDNFEIGAIKYGLTIGETVVTALNADDVLGDGKVSFAPAKVVTDQPGSSTPATLTLSGANINGGVDWSGSGNLTIALNGGNSITNLDGDVLKNSNVSTPRPSLLFTKTENATSGKLTLTTSPDSQFETIAEFGSHTGLYDLGETENEKDKTRVITSSLLSGGSGTSGDPFKITTAQDLKDFSSYISKGVLSNGYFSLGDNDIVCEGLTDFEPIDPFTGTFDGNNKTISGLIITTSKYYVGLFGQVNGGIVKNLTLDNLTIEGGTEVGGIAGKLYGDNGKITNCKVNNSTITCGEHAQNPEVGGIAGRISAEISNCEVSASTITAITDNTDSSGPTAEAGGIVGHAEGGEISSCITKSTTTVTCNHTKGGTPFAGAVIGLNNTDAGTVLSANEYESSVTTTAGGTTSSGQDQRGIGSSSDELNKVMMAGTKKVTISATLSNGTLSLGEMANTYYLDESDASTGQLLALYVLPESAVSLVASSEEGYKPTFKLSNNNVAVTPKEFENSSRTIQFNFEMPADDVTATIAFARDLGSQLYTLETEQEVYTYTGEGIEPRISLTISTDSQNPVTVTLSKDTDFEIQKCMKDVDGTFTPIFEEDGKTPKTPVDAGSYQVYISGIGSYTGEAVLEFSITKATTDECIWFYHLVDGKEETVQDGEDATYGTAYDAPKLKNPLNLAVTLSCNAENGSNGTASDVATIDDEGNITILKAGTVYVYAVTEGNENYEAGEVHYQLDIEKGSLENVTITEIDDQVYTGTAIEPELTVTTPDGTSVTTDDYGIGYTPDNTNVGQVTITLTAKEGSEKFTGSKTTTFNIIPPTPTIAFDNTKTYLNTDKISISIDEAYATSSETAGITNTIYYSWDENPVTGTEYPEGDVAAQTGTLTAWVSATKSGATYESEKTTQAFTVKKDIASCTVTLPENTTYTGAAFVPVVAPNGTTTTTLTEGTDYTVSYQKVAGETATDVKSMIDAGTYKITITGKGNYGGTKEISDFQIAQASLADAAISKLIVGDKEYTSEVGKVIEIPYTGEAIQPEVVVVFNGGTVTVDASEYTVSYGENNTEISTTTLASVTVTSTGKNFITGTSKSLEFKIVPAPVTITTEAQTVTYNAKQQAYTGASVNNENAALVIAYYTSEEDRANALNALTGAPTDAGTYYVSVTLNAESLQHYTAEPANVTFTIAQLDISEAVITLDNEELTYNGEVQSVTVEKVMVGDIEVAADYYEINGNFRGTEAGNYTLIVTAKTVNNDGSEFKNNFKGSAEKAWKINHRTASAEELGFRSETQTASTYYDPNEDFNLPEGYVGYIITGINGNSVTTQRVSYIPKGVAVLVEKGQSSESPNDAIPYPSTLPLKGTLEPVDVTSITGGIVYVLYNGEFVKSTSGTIPAHRCYLLVATNVASGTRSFSIDHGDGTTSLREMKGEKWADGEWYTLQGQRIAKPAKGLYILNGKKVVIK